MHALPETWYHLESMADLKQAIERSKQQLVVLFKHSKRCGVSFMAEERLIEDWDFTEEVAFYHLDLIEHRAISNAIAKQLGVPHQSPQLILLRHTKVLHHASHSAIRTALIQDALEVVK